MCLLHVYDAWREGGRVRGHVRSSVQEKCAYSMCVMYV